MILDRPHPEVRPEGREPLADREGESTLLSQSGEEKGSDEVVPGTSVFPLSETGMSGTFWGNNHCCALSRGQNVSKLRPVWLSPLLLAAHLWLEER